nr:small RNA binding protein 1-like [Lolium perenne]
MQKMKALADAMAAAGVPITDDEIVDYIVIGLGSAYNAVTAPLTLGNSTEAISYATFYSNVLSFESLQAQQAHAKGWTSSVNAAMRPNPAFQGGGSSTHPYDNNGQQGQSRGSGGNGGYGGRNDGGGYDRNDGGSFGGRNDGRTGGGNGGDWDK